MRQQTGDGTTDLPVYLSAPQQPNGAGVLVCHAWWGLTPFFTGVCDQLADAGYVALAPDLFNGQTATTLEAADALRKQADRKVAKRQMRLALDYLAAHEQVEPDRLGAIGFSYGASYALEAARLRADQVKAVVVFYGTGGGKYEKTRAAYQGHFAETDAWGAHDTKVAALRKRLAAAGTPVDFHTYPQTEHWFFEDERPEYDPQAAGAAWQRMLAFLQNYL